MYLKAATKVKVNLYLELGYMEVLDLFVNNLEMLESKRFAALSFRFSSQWGCTHRSFLANY